MANRTTARLVLRDGDRAELERRVRSVTVPAAVAQRALQISAPPVGTPLPHIAGHVVQAEPIRGEALSRRRAQIAVLTGVLHRELSLPDVAAVLATWSQILPPVLAGALSLITIVALILVLSGVGAL